MILVRFKPRNILLVDNSTNYWTTVLTVHCIQDRYKVILFSGGGVHSSKNLYINVKNKLAFYVN